jgi:ferredoxin-NADP reductase
VVEAAAPRGEFCLVDGDSPAVLVSAGIGATPVLAMAHALAAAGSRRQIWWLHTTRDTQTHTFAAEVTALIDALPTPGNIFYTGDGHRPDVASIAALYLPAGATVYLCSPGQFMDAMRNAVTTAGIDPGNIHTELFGALPPINPGVVGAPTAARPHPPERTPGTGPRIAFARSGLSVNWSPYYRSILELAEACDVPTRYSCRSGVCHTCLTAVLDGTTTYSRPPLEEPSAGNVLICTAAPRSDLVLDL